VASALDAGAPAVKLFPASLGGIAHMRALWGPFPGLRVVPTGGITSANANEWLAAGAFALAAGSELCPREAVAAQRWHELTASAERFLGALGPGAES
jgi:2-dehydro-3-deoxyphosphogluconate aldolase/(4S)-4-hydroxy-2-oxoglutarate aldolase